MRISTFLSISLLVVLTTSTAYAESTSPVDAHLNDARSLYEAGHWNEASEAFETAYRDAEEKTEIKAASALEWATLLWEQGNYPEAKRLVEEAVDLARDLGMDDATGELLSTLGHIESSMGELTSAESTLNACIQMTEQLDDDVHRALCRLGRRTVRQLQGEDPGPEEQFQTDLQTLENAESARSTGVSMTKTAGLYRDNGDFDQAEQLLKRAGEIYRDLGSVPGQLRNRLRRAQLEHHRHNFEAARELTDGLLERFRQMDNRPMVIHTLALKAEDAIHSGDVAEGLTQYRRAVSEAESIDNPQLAGRARLAICEMNVADSPPHCERAVDIFESTGMKFLEIRARSAHGRTLQTRGNYKQARTEYRSAIDQLEQVVDTDEGPHARSLAFLYANRCQTNAELETTGGYRSCTQALEKLDQIEWTDDDRLDMRAATHHATARTAVQAERSEDAIEHYSDAAERYQQLDEQRHRLLAADTLLQLGALQARHSDHRNDAVDSFENGLQLTEGLDLDDGDAVTTHVSLKTQIAQRHLNDRNWSEAIKRLDSLTQTAREHDDKSTAAWAYNGLANAYLQTDRRDDAVEALEAGLPLAEEAEDDDLVEKFRENLVELKE